MRQWNAANPDKVAATKAKRRYGPNRAQLLQKHAGYNGKYKYANQEKVLAKRREYNARIRQFIVDFFGGSCMWCGYSDIRALQVDHINSDGAEDRRNGMNSKSAMYKFIRENADLSKQKYQLLCANCNSIKRVEKKEYARWTGAIGAEA